MKRLLLIGIFCVGFQAQIHAMSAIPSVNMGPIAFFNTLPEPVSFKQSGIMDGGKPIITDNSVIPARGTKNLHSGFIFQNNDLWPVPLEITLQRQGHPAEEFVLIEDVSGTHNITLSKSGNLLLTKNQLEEKREAAEKMAAQAPAAISIPIKSVRMVPTNEISQDPNVNNRDEHGKTALMNAAANGDTATVQRLLARGADRDMQDRDGNTALMLAVKKSALKTIEALIKGKTDIDIKDNDGNTALMYAVKNGKMIVVDTLVAAGADINEANNAGQTPYSEATKSGILRN